MLKAWRKMTWALIAWTVFMVLWIAGLVASSCSGESQCHDLHTSGPTYAFVLWFMGFVVLSLIWFMTRGPGEP